MEGLVNLMGENEDKEIQAAINLALVQQRVKSLEQWKCGYEEAQNQRWDNFEKKMDKFVDNLTIQVNNLAVQITNQKDSWLSKAPWSLVALLTGLFGFSASLVTYLLTK